MSTRIAFAFGLLLTAATGCADEPTTGQDESFSTTLSSSRSRDLAPAIPVFDVPTIGSSIEAKVGALADGEAYYEDETPWGDTVCVIRNYRADGYDYINHEHCPGDSNILRAYSNGERTPITVWADHDDDGRIDAWTNDDWDGTGYRRNLYDDDKDGRLDRETIDVELVEGLDLSLYEGCEAPEHPAMRILEDLDGDGMFEVESVTAGKGPDGGWSYWLCN